MNSKSGKEDWELERECLINHLRRLADKWLQSERVEERLSARHFQTVVDELDNGKFLENAKLLSRSSWT